MTESEAKNFVKNHLTGWKTFNSQNLALLNSDDRLIRALPDVREHEFYQIARYLQRYVDPKNGDKSAVVVDPEVDDQTIDGTWRHVSCYLIRTDANGNQAQNGKYFSLVQELRRGFLTTLADDEARLVQTEIGPGSGASPNANKEKTFTLQWNAVDPDLMESLADAKAITAATAAPKYRRAIVGEQEAGTVDLEVTGLDVRTHAVSTGLAEDGTGTVTVVLGDSRFELSAFANWLGSKQAETTYIYNIPEQLAQGVIDGLKSKGVDVAVTSWQGGMVSIRSTANDLTGITLESVKVGENCDFTEYASFYWSGEDETSLPIPGTIPAGTSYTGRRVTENGDGTYTIVLEWRVRKYRDLTEYGSEYRADRDTTRKEWKGVTNQDLGTALGGQAGKIVQVNKSFNDDCSTDIRRDVITPEAQTTTHDSQSRADQTAERVIATNASAKADASGGGSGTIVNARSRENEFGLFDNEIETITANAQETTHDSESRADRTAERTVATNAAAKADASGGGSGTIVNAQSRKNEFGLFDNTVETVTAKAQSTTHDSQSRADQTASRVVESNAAAKADASGGGSGTIVNARSRENEFGLFDNEIETITAVDQTWTDEEVRADQSSVTTRHTHAAAEPTAPVQEDGKIKRVRSRETEFGDYDTTEEEITAVDQSTTSGEDRHDQKSAVTEHTQADAAVTTPPAASAGTIVRVQNRETEFGKFATREETITAKDQSTTSGEDRHDQKSAVTEHTQADTAVTTPPTATAGTIVRVQNRETEFGRFATREETITAKAQTTTHVSQRRADQTVDRVVATNADAKVDAPARSTGTATSAQSRENEFGKFDNQTEEITAILQDTGWITFAHPDGTVGVRVVSNGTSTELNAIKTTLGTRATAGDRTNLNARLNQFGLYDITASYQPVLTSVSSTSWGAQSDKTVSYGRFKDHNGTVWLAMKVNYYYNTTDGGAFSDLSESPTSGYVNVTSYRGVASGARRVGVGRWVTVRVEVEVVTTTPVTVS